MKKNKKVGLVAVSNNNYGSQLQTFAMHFVLNKIGVDNEVIKYKQDRTRQLKRLFNPSFLSIKGKAIARDAICKIRYPKISSGFKERNAEFERFKTKNIIYSPTITSRERLEDYIKKYDGVVLGSDQVWHPANLEMDYFTLSFVPSDIPKIAYAPSFGVSDIPTGQLESTKSFLRRIDAISVRESKGAEIVNSLIKRDVPVVCDPTALLSSTDWDCIRRPNRYSTEKYIFCYFLGNNPKHREFAERVKALTGFKIIALQHMDEFVKGDLSFGDIVPFDEGPDDFVSLIADASIVLTDSFHGTMFSIYYHKNFFTFSRFSGAALAGTNSRIVSILNQLDIQDRLLTALENPEDVIDRNIDWDEVDKKLDTIRSSSMSYLMSSLEKYNLINKEKVLVTVADKRKEECTGCSACVHVCPVSALHFERDEEGFDYPALDEDACVKCGKCLQTCPVNKKYISSASDAFAARNSERDIRIRSSSGGIFTSLAESVIDDGGVIVGAAFDDSMILRHVIVDKKDDIGPLCASKYVQSTLGDVFRETKKILDKGRKVLFCGTPCQVAGVHEFLGRDYDNLIIIDVLCYGVPSPGIFKDFISYLEDKHSSKVKKFYFREKSYGYASPNVKAIFADNSVEEMSYDIKSYTNLFFKGIIARPSCSECKFKGVDRVSDLTLGDYWGIGKREKAMDDDTGTTLVMAHTDKGRDAIIGLKGACVKKMDFNTVVSDCGPMLMESAVVNSRRDSFFRLYKNVTYIEAARMFAPNTAKNVLANTIKPIILRVGLTKTGIFKVIKNRKIKTEKLSNH